MLKEFIRKVKIRIFYFNNRIKLKNKNITILSNNCTAGIIYHELKLKFLSPTINLLMEKFDFLNFVEHIEDYKKSKLVEVKEPEKPYPVGILINDKYGDIRIEFMHYKSFNEAEEKWNKRFERINTNNLFVILDIGPQVDPLLMEKFYKLNRKNKIALVPKNYNSPQCFGISCYNENWHPGNLYEYDPKTGKKYLNEWNYVDFFNQKENKN